MTFQHTSLPGVFIYDRSKIDQAKYKCLKWAIWVSAAGGLCALAFALYFGHHPKPAESQKTDHAVQAAVPAASSEFIIQYPAVPSKNTKPRTFLLNKTTGEVGQLVERGGINAVFDPLPVEGGTQKPR